MQSDVLKQFLCRLEWDGAYKAMLGDAMCLEFVEILCSKYPKPLCSVRLKCKPFMSHCWNLIFNQLTSYHTRSVLHDCSF